MTIAAIGTGYVGLVTGVCRSERNIATGRISFSTDTIAAGSDAGAAVISVGTPTGQSAVSDFRLVGGGHPKSSGPVVSKAGALEENPRMAPAK